MSLLRRIGSFVSSRSIPDRIDLILTITLWLGLAVMLMLVASIAHAWFMSNRKAARQVSERLSAKPRITLWVCVTTCIVGVLFWMGYATFLDASVAPGDAYDIQSLSDGGAWKFTYPTGKVSRNELVVPVGKPVRLILSSKDEPHGLFIPQLRLQQVALPGRYTTLWFKVPSQQSISIKCTEGCPRDPSSRPSLLAVSDSHFEAWLAPGDKMALASAGAK